MPPASSTERSAISEKDAHETNDKYDGNDASPNQYHPH